MIWFTIRNAFVEDKRRLENRITQLEEEIEDEQNNNEQNNEKLRKIQSDYEKLMADLHLEKSNVAKAEVWYKKILKNLNQVQHFSDIFSSRLEIDKSEIKILFYIVYEHFLKSFNKLEMRFRKIIFSVPRIE